MLLPHLLFPLWNKHILEGIANTIGRYVAVDEDFHLAYDKRIARVLVEMDISVGLAADVEILCNERLLAQRLDYLHVSFRCSRCHKTGHLRRACPFLRYGSANSGSDGSPTVTERVDPTEQDHSILGIFSNTLSPSDVVSDSFLDAIDDLILSRAKAPPPVSSPAPYPLSNSMSSLPEPIPACALAPP